MPSATELTETQRDLASRAVFSVLAAISVCHLLNDMVQSLIPAIYPILRTAFRLNFAQIGLITLTNQLTASILQPFVGMYTDRRPLPYSLCGGMAFTLAGLLLLSAAPSFPAILMAVALVGVGSSVFHPESSRVARMASGGQHGLAQSVFQVGGNTGSALGPLLAAFIVVPRGQGSLAWFSIAALLGIAILFGVGRWYKAHKRAQQKVMAPHHAAPAASAPEDLILDRDSGGAGFFKILLYRELEQLLHVLRYCQISRRCRHGANYAVRIPGGGGGWNHHRRPGRRPG